jgi:cobalt-zinc-cadmium efflux system protein
MSEVAQAIERECPSVADVHHVHVWQLTGGSHIATLHASLVGDTSPADAILSIRRIMHERYGVNHITVQLDEIRPCGQRRRMQAELNTEFDWEQRRCFFPVSLVGRRTYERPS